MGTTSDKLTYLAGTKDKIKTTINYTGVGITTDTFRNYPKKLYDGYLDILNNGTSTIISNLPKVEGTGKSLQLNNTAYAPMQLTLKGDTQQDSTTGKNLFDGTKVETTNTTNWGISFTNNVLSIQHKNSYTTGTPMYEIGILANGTYTMNFVGTGSIGLYLDNTYSKMLNNGTTFSVNGSQAVKFTFSADENTTITFTNVMLILGTTPTSYEPYTNGASPNPSYPQPIQVVTGRNDINVCGKNLFDATTFESQLVSGKIKNDSGVETSDVNSTYSTYMIPVQASTYYFKGYFQRIYFYDSNKNWVGRIIYNSSTTAPMDTSYTFTQNGYIQIQIRNASYSTYKGEEQIEKGDEASTYEAYTGYTQEINLGKNLFDKNNANVLNAYIDSSHTTITSEANNRTIYIPCEPNTTYTLTKIASSYKRQIAYTTETPALNVQTYGMVEMVANTTTGTITTGDNAKYLVVRLWTSAQDTGTTFDEMKASIQIEKGSSASTYSPYFTPIELCKIGDYQDRIFETSGKNLFDKDNATYDLTHYKNDNGVITSGTSGSGYCEEYIAVKSNTQYTINCANFGITRLYYYDNSKGWLSRTDVITNNLPYTFTTPNNCGFIQFQISTADYNDTSVMIEKGSTASTYQPYGSNEWYINKEIGSVVLDENATVTIDTAVSGLSYRSFNIESTTLKASSICVCDKLLYQESSIYSNDIQGIKPTSGGYFKIKVLDSSLTTSALMKNWLGNNNLLVYYQLSTPTYTKITDSTLISQLENFKSITGQTNISQDTSDLEGYIFVKAIKEYDL